MNPTTVRMADGAFKGSSPLIDPAGVYWRVNRESFLLLGGGAALLLQLAHPLVAAGVADHSGFREEPVRRLYRTIRTMQEIVYEDRHTALAAARQVKRVHAGVRGVLSEGTARFPAGTPYRASDPHLLMWVHATLVSTALNTYETFLPPLTAAERDTFYEESKMVGRVLGLADEDLPRDYEHFTHYFQGMLDGGELAVTPGVRALAENVIHPPISWFPRIAGDALSVVTAALLPAPVRAIYDLRWGYKRQLAWRLVRRSLRQTLPFIPNVVRAGRHARRGERRARAGLAAA
jgi:uncharacterized protein (DUF2236 family)